MPILSLAGTEERCKLCEGGKRAAGSNFFLDFNRKEDII